MRWGGRTSEIVQRIFRAFFGSSLIGAQTAASSVEEAQVEMCLAGVSMCPVEGITEGAVERP